jgi:cytidine deaminase
MGEGADPVSQDAVNKWLFQARELGIRSIICLLADDQLKLYSSLGTDLISYYREKGFEVAHVPAPDHLQPPLTESQLDDVWQAYQQLPKPVLVHCSAGIDRTGRAIEHITGKLESRMFELINAASTIIHARYRHGFHHVGAALRSKSGKIFSAVHLEASVGRIAVCAEAIALGMAAAEGDSDVEMIVAVSKGGEVMPLCGMCRELVSDYAPDALVIVPGPTTPMIVPVARLLPYKYQG